jgi:hypothetical protein
MRIRHVFVGTALVAASAVLASPAFGDPTGSKNAFTLNGVCSGDRTVQVVVNSANGQGQGAQNNDANEAEFSPAHVLGTNEVFHPTAFDITFTFTPAKGPSQSFTDTSSRPNQTGNVTCQVSGSQTDAKGNTFSISGTVTGWFS